VDEGKFWDIVNEQGWSDLTVADVLLDFVSTSGLGPALLRFAQKRADFENQEVSR